MAADAARRCAAGRKESRLTGRVVDEGGVHTATRNDAVRRQSRPSTSAPMRARQFRSRSATTSSLVGHRAARVRQLVGSAHSCKRVPIPAPPLARGRRRRAPTGSVATVRGPRRLDAVDRGRWIGAAICRAVPVLTRQVAASARRRGAAGRSWPGRDCRPARRGPLSTSMELGIEAVHAALAAQRDRWRFRCC